MQLRSLALVLLGLFMVSCSTPTPTPNPPTATALPPAQLSGQVAIGPACNEPACGPLAWIYDDRVLALRPDDPERPTVATGLSESGHFDITLPAGNYTLDLVPCPFSGCADLEAMALQLAPGEQRDLQVSVDTGLRVLEPRDPIESFAEALRSEVGVEAAVGEQYEYLFSIPGVRVTVAGSEVLALPFEGPEDALLEVSTISPTGSMIGLHSVLWARPVSFFRSGSLLVFYNAADPVVLQALTTILGPRFAGGEIEGFPTVPIIPPKAQAAARKALAQALPTNAPLRLLHVEPQTFPDTSLDCPEPGTGYDQVLTDGYLFVYEDSAQQHTVRASLEGNIVALCTGGLQPSLPRAEIPSPWLLDSPLVLLENEVIGAHLLAQESDAQQIAAASPGIAIDASASIAWGNVSVIGIGALYEGCGHSLYVRDARYDPETEVLDVELGAAVQNG